MTTQKLKKTKVVGKICLVGADHIFVPIIWIWKDLGPMCFWSHGKPSPGKVSKMKVVEHLPNRKVGQVLTPTPIPLALPRVGSPKWGPGNLAASNRPHSCE